MGEKVLASPFLFCYNGDVVNALGNVPVGQRALPLSLKEVHMEKDKLLKLMRFWLFGTFIIVFAAVTVFAGMVVGTAIFSQPNYWLIIGITAIVCVVGYYIYKGYLDKQ